MEDKSQETHKPGKDDISKPTDFKHVMHVSLNTNTGNIRRMRSLRSKKEEMYETADEVQNEDRIKSNLGKPGASVTKTHVEVDDGKEHLQELQNNTMMGKNQETLKPTKGDISKPKDFKHVSHVGWKTDTSNSHRVEYLKSKNVEISETLISDAVQAQNEEVIKSNMHKTGASESETRSEIVDEMEVIQEFRSNTLKRRSKLTKEDIGYPFNFQHVSHVGWDNNRGFDPDESSSTDEFKTLLESAGVSDVQLQDQEIREFIYQFIETHGGLNAKDMHNEKHINTLKNKKEKKPETSNAEQSQKADELSLLFEKAGVPDIRLQDQAAKDLVYDFIETHWGLNEYMSYHTRRTRQKNGDISTPQDFKHVLHVGCEENTNEENAPNADEHKPVPDLTDTEQKDQETKELENDRGRRRAPQPPPTPTSPVSTLNPPSPSTSSEEVPVSATSTSDPAEFTGPKLSPPSPSATAKPIPNPATANSNMETPPSGTSVPALTPVTPSASTPSASPTTSTTSSLSHTTSKMTPPVATRKLTTLPLVITTISSAVPTVSIDRTSPLRKVVPMPTIRATPPTQLSTVTTNEPPLKPKSPPSSSVKVPMPTARSLPSSPSAGPRPARRPAPQPHDNTPGTDILQLKDNFSETLTKTKDRLYKLVANGKYSIAVDLIKTLDKPVLHDVMSDTIQKLLDSHSTAKAKLMSLAYKLWYSDAKSIVRIHFPLSFKLILGREDVKIVNKGYRQALRLDASIDENNGRAAWGDAKDKSSKRVSWQLVPVWSNNEVTFKLHNVDCNMFLKLGVDVDDDGDRAAWGSPNCDTDSHRYYLEPHMEDEELVFFLINYQCGQGLKLVVTPNDKGDRALLGHKGDIYRDEGRFRWIISAW